MPVLPIADEQGRLLPLAHHILFAYTAYPVSPELREEFIASALARMANERAPDLLGKLSAQPWFVSALHRAPKPDKVTRNAIKSSVSAWPCGEMLLLMLGAAIHHPGLDVSPSATIKAMETFHRPGRTRTGKQVTASKSKLWGAWSTFRSVAHFHAARQVWIDHYGEDKDKKLADWQIDHVAYYLALSEEIRKEAVARRFLTYEETWRVPESLPLPRLGFTAGALEPEMLALLKKYKPEYSKKAGL